MQAQVVKVVEYSAIKGKGVYLQRDGAKIGFSYRQFLDQKIIEPGRLAILTEDGTLHPAKRRHGLHWIFGRKFKWQS
jgi:hypothetical protein